MMGVKENFLDDLFFHFPGHMNFLITGADEGDISLNIHGHVTATT